VRPEKPDRDVYVLVKIKESELRFMRRQGRKYGIGGPTAISYLVTGYQADVRRRSAEVLRQATLVPRLPERR
jgi:hypothetical protein